MTFKEIISQFIPIKGKNDLNKLLAMVERYFGVFSRDMELDIRAVISSQEVVDYFDRIIHEEHPKLEYDKVEKPKKKTQTANDGEVKHPKKKVKKKWTVNEELLYSHEIARSKEKNGDDNTLESSRALSKLAKSERDYSKETWASRVKKIKLSDKEKWKANKVHIISIPMGGQNKKY